MSSPNIKCSAKPWASSMSKPARWCVLRITPSIRPNQQEVRHRKRFFQENRRVGQALSPWPPQNTLAVEELRAIDFIYSNLLFERSPDFCLNNPTGAIVKIYNITGYLIIFLYMLACMYSAPAHLGPWTGMLIGGVYFIFCWFFGGLYLADVLHLGIAHRSLDYMEWFMNAVTIVNNTFGLYVDPIASANRHRLHHKHADHPGDPNKLSGDGFWRTLYLCLMPYQCKENLAGDKILKSWTFRVVANPVFAILAQALVFI